MDGSSAQHLKDAVDLQGAGDISGALKICSRIIAQNPSFAIAYRFAASLHIQSKNYDAAELTLKSLLAVDQQDTESIQLLALVLSDNQKPHEAHALYSSLLTVTTTSKLLNDYAVNLCRLGHASDAIQLYRKIIEQESDQHIALASRYNLGCLELFLGDFDKGWNGYNLRYQTIDDKKPALAPIWQGQDLSRKKLVVYREQGIGDELLMSTCYPDVLQAGSNISILTNPRLVKLFQRSFPQAAVIDISTVDDTFINKAQFDYQIGAADLPSFYRRSRQLFDDFKPLQVDYTKKQHYRDRLKQLAATEDDDIRFIGLSWKAGKAIGEEGNHRSVELSTLFPLLQLPNVCWVNLQHGDVDAQIKQACKATGAKVLTIHEASPMGDFDEYGALIAALDCVVSVDNAVANFSGAIGKKCFLLASAYPFWWWTHGQKTNPWFPSVQVYRRNGEDRSWASIVIRLREVLGDEAREALRDPRTEPLIERSIEPQGALNKSGESNEQL